MIYNEEKLSIEFYNRNNMYNIKFNESNYFLLKYVCNDINITNNIIKSIRDVIKDLKVKVCENLVFCDFVSAFKPKNIVTPNWAYIKTTRNEYLKEIKIRSYINNLDFDYELFHKKLIISLRLNNVITRKEVRAFNNEKWYTSIQYTLGIENYDLNWVNEVINIENPFKIIFIEKKPYMCSSFRNIYPAIVKKKELRSKKISLEHLEKISSIPMRLSSETYNKLAHLIDRLEGEILKETNSKDLNDYFKNLKMKNEDSKFAYMMMAGYEPHKDIKKKDIYKLLIEIKEEEKSIVKWQQMVSSILILKNCNKDVVMYLGSFSDLRSRMYFAGIISPTFYKIFRFIYEFNIKKTIENEKNSIFYKKIIKYSKNVEKYNLDEKRVYYAIILFIEVGKNFVKGKKVFITTCEIIERGIKEYENRTQLSNFEDNLYLNKTYINIDELIKNNLNENTIIFKDATASGLQNYGTILGYREDKLKILNINSDEWCDTYYYIIDKFLKKCKYRKRKYWKSTIMTIPYNASWFTCFIDFINKLREDNIEYNELDENEKDELKKIHKNFYDFIKKEIKEEFYKNKKFDFEINFNERIKKIIISEFMNKSKKTSYEEKVEIINNDDRIYYYDKKILFSESEYKVNFRKGRDKYVLKNYVYEYDEKKTKTAFEANLMHNLDAKLVKHIVKKYDIIPVHDCFGVRICELHLIMDEINEYYSSKIGFKTYSIHIII